MSLTPDLQASYLHVVKDLEGKRDGVQTELNGLQKRLRDLNEKISGLYREMGLSVPAADIATRTGNLRTFDPSQKYSMISVHWAILHLLSEAKDPMTTAEIADALTKAGVKTRAANFTNNVSAVLSANMGPKGEEEVEVIDGRWKLTEIGLNKIAFIVSGSKFRLACPWIMAGAARE